MLEEVNDASDCNSRNSFVGCNTGRLCKFGRDGQPRARASEHHAQFDHAAATCIGTGTCPGALTGTGARSASASEVITR